jgi:hypothetical protein
MRAALYTVSRCKADDSPYGLEHGSDDGESTLCGQNIDHNWYILSNAFDGKITCKKCVASRPTADVGHPHEKE